MLAPFRYRSAHVLLLGVILLGGCSKEKLSELADKAKQAVGDQAGKVSEAVSDKVGATADAAKEQLSLAGTMQFQLPDQVETSGCYVQFLSPGSGRGNVLRISSYREPKQESFPSAMLHGQVQASGLSEMVGQSIAAKLYVQGVSGGPIWFCPPGTQVQVKIISFDGSQLQAELSGSMRNSHSGSDQPVTGKLTGVLSSS